METLSEGEKRSALMRLADSAGLEDVERCLAILASAQGGAYPGAFLFGLVAGMRRTVPA